MENIAKILSKSEKFPVAQDVFNKEHPEFFEDIGPEQKLEDGTFLYKCRDLEVSFKCEDFSNNPESFDWVSYRTDKNYNRKDYFLLNDFKIKNGNNEFINEDDLKDINIIFKKNPQKLTNGFAFKDSNFIALETKPSTLDGILTLLHELGHLKDEHYDENDIRLSELRLKSIMAGGPTKKNGSRKKRNYFIKRKKCLGLCFK